MTRTTQPRFAFAIGAAVAAMAGMHAQAQDEAAAAAAASAEEQLDRTPEDCVLVNRVARKVGVNDHQVVFIMRGNTYYLNVLDGACQSLTAGETRLVFHYENTGSARIARLCDNHSFTVERQTSRLGCGLGQFNPITSAEVKALTGIDVPPSAAIASGDEEEGSSRRRRDRE